MQMDTEVAGDHPAVKIIAMIQKLQQQVNLIYSKAAVTLSKLLFPCAWTSKSINMIVEC